MRQKKCSVVKLSSTPHWIRTNYLLLRRQLLYPDELEVHHTFSVLLENSMNEEYGQYVFPYASPAICRNRQIKSSAIKLSYTPHWIRTNYLLLRRQLLYPDELEVHRTISALNELTTNREYGQHQRRRFFRLLELFSILHQFIYPSAIFRACNGISVLIFSLEGCICIAKSYVA